MLTAGFEWVYREVMLRLHETGSVWNWYKIGTDKHCVYTGPSGPLYNPGAESQKMHETRFRLPH